MTPAEVILAALARAKDEIVFDAEKHVYTWADTGVVVPGVTTIQKVLAKDALVPWAAKLQSQADIAAVEAWFRDGRPGSFVDAIEAVAHAHAKARDKAADAGTQAHALIEHHSKLMLGIPSEEPDASDEARYIFAGWQEWAARVGYKPLAVESRVYSKRRGYAGTLDAIAELPGLALGLAVCDWKSGKDLYDEHHMQSVAYRRALSEMTEGIGAEAPMAMLPGVVVILPKTAGPIKHFEIPHTEATWQAFIGACAVYQWKQELHPPRARRSRKVA